MICANYFFLSRLDNKSHGFRNYTMKELLNLLAKLRVQDINGRRILYPVSKEQRIVYEAFDVEPPTE